MNFEEQAAALTTCDTCRYIAEQGNCATALEAYEVLKRTQTNLHAKIEELESGSRTEALAEAETDTLVKGWKMLADDRRSRLENVEEKLRLADSQQLAARVAELEEKLAHSIGRELVILTQLRECIWVLEQSHGEGARVAERAKAVMTGEEGQS